jgi:hypothetical protein
MNENWRSVVGFEHDATGPDRLITWTPRPLNSSAVNLKRDEVATLRQRSPHRAASNVRGILSTYSVEWDWPLTSTLEYLRIILEMIGDPGRSDTADETTTYKVGRGKDPIRSNIYLDGVDGSHYQAVSCILTDWTLNVDLAQHIRSESTFAARELRMMESAYSWPDEAPASGRVASAKDALVTIGGAQYPVFGWSVGFQREASAAGLDEDGIASAWGGNLTFDIGGKLVCRAPADEFEEAFTSQRFDPITAVVELPGGASLTLQFPHCVLQADSKRIVSPELYEYALSWSALQAADSELATLILEA